MIEWTAPPFSKRCLVGGHKLTYCLSPLACCRARSRQLQFACDIVSVLNSHGLLDGLWVWVPKLLCTVLMLLHHIALLQGAGRGQTFLTSALGLASFYSV